MQTVSHITKNIHPIFDDIEMLYGITSVKEQQQSLISPRFDNSFKPVFDLFSDYGGVEYAVECVSKHFITVEKTVKNNKAIIVCTSGGKDSLATILYYRKKKYKVYVYHLKGINLTYKDEYKAVEQICDKLKLPLITEEVSLKGKQEWVEHPLKNMIIASMALQYGIREGITTNIAFGNFSTSSLNSDPFEICGGDCKEVWQAYEDIIDTVLPGFKINTPLANFQDTIDILLEKKDLIQYTQSCIGPYRYREYLRDNNQRKYNIQLPEHRCGSCWKCCLEYCVFCDNDVYEYNEAYYKHCMEILQSTLYKETGIKYNIHETWQHYFFYDRSKSKWVV